MVMRSRRNVATVEHGELQLQDPTCFFRDVVSHSKDNTCVFPLRSTNWRQDEQGESEERKKVGEEGKRTRARGRCSDYQDVVVQLVIEPEWASQSREEDLNIHAE
jgi:hypothetical protein